MRLATIGAFGLICGFPLAASAAEPPVHLAPHRAVYDLSLAKTGGARNIEDARGRIAFDFTGDDCEGYTLNYRQVTVLESSETGQKTSDLRTASFESGDGKSLRFKTDSALGGSSKDPVDGNAERQADSVVIRLKQPKRDTLTVEGDAVFPSTHMKQLIVAARAQQPTLALKVFDGSDDGRKVYDTLAVIGKRIEPGPADGLEAAARQDGLAKLARWPVTLSYFAPGTGERTPVYTLSFDLYENGVSRALKLDYGDFALTGEMQTLQLLPETSCKR